MLYNQTDSNKNFQKNLEGYQKNYKKLVNNDFRIIKLKNLTKKESKTSLYDILFEPKYDNIFDFFKGNNK